MKTRLALWGTAALVAGLSGATPADGRTPDTLLQPVLQPGHAIRRATIACDYIYRARPEPRDVEAEAQSLERQAIAAGKPPAVARSMADAQRRFGRVASKGLVRRARAIHRYDATSWSLDERGPGAVNGQPYREAWYANGRETYQLIRTPHGTQVHVTAAPRAQPLAFGPALFFRRPQLARVLQEGSLARAGQDAQGRQIYRGELPGARSGESTPAVVTLWIDPRHGHWPARLEVRKEDILVERCVASGFRKRPGGVWFPTKVVDEMFALHGPDQGAVRLRRSYVVRSARFNEAAGPAPAPPQIEGSARVTDYRFASPVLYTSNGTYRAAAAVREEARRAAARQRREVRVDRRVLAVRACAGLAMFSLAALMLSGRRRRSPGLGGNTP